MLKRNSIFYLLYILFLLPKVDDLQTYWKFHLNYWLIKVVIDLFFFLWCIHPIVLINMVTILKASATFHYQWLSNFLGIMLPKEYLLYIELFSVAILWAIQPFSGWEASAHGVAALGSATV